MKITIDKAGRVVVPKSLRDRYNLRPGSVIEVENEPDGIYLKVVQEKPALKEKDGILIHHGVDTVHMDIKDFINKERERRNEDMIKRENY